MGEKRSTVKLSDFRGKRNVVLAFYPLDWTSTCTAEMPALNVGDVAQDFEVPAVTGKDKSKLKLSDFRGKKNVVIAFYPLDWTPV